MKKTLVILSAACLALTGYSQGTVNTRNGSAELVTTNGTSIGQGTGVVASYANGGSGYSYALLTSSMLSSGVAQTSLAFYDSSIWSNTGLTLQDYTTAGYIWAGSVSATVPSNWNYGVTESYVIIGWSSSLGTLSQVLTEYKNNTWTSTGYFGYSAIGYGQAGGGPNSLPAFSLWGTSANASGTPIGTGLTLYGVTSVPEPGTMALAALGGASLLLFRRKK